MWQEIGTALALMLIIEGLMPFLYPNRWKDLVLKLAEIDAGTMRIMGFFSMMIGLVAFLVVRS